MRIKHGDYFAFAWLAFRPDTEVYCTDDNFMLDDWKENKC